MSSSCPNELVRSLVISRNLWSNSSKLSFKYYFNDKISLNTSIGQGFKAPDFRQLYLNFSNSTSGYTVLGKYEEINGIENLRSNDNLLRLLINEAAIE